MPSDLIKHRPLTAADLDKLINELPPPPVSWIMAEKWIRFRLLMIVHVILILKERIKCLSQSS